MTSGGEDPQGGACRAMQSIQPVHSSRHTVCPRTRSERPFSQKPRNRMLLSIFASRNYVKSPNPSGWTECDGGDDLIGNHAQARFALQQCVVLACLQHWAGIEGPSHAAGQQQQQQNRSCPAIWVGRVVAGFPSAPPPIASGDHWQGRIAGVCSWALMPGGAVHALPMHLADRHREGCVGQQWAFAL